MTSPWPRTSPGVPSLTAHRKFSIPPWPARLPWRRILSIAGTTAGDYLESVHYADAALGDLLHTLQAQHLLDRTLLVVYGDHAGINRSDVGVANLPLAHPTNEAGWLEFERRVPMLFVGDGLPAMKVATQAGQIDIAPTIAGLLSVPTKHTGFLGRDLLRTEARPVVFWSGSVRDEHYTYLEGRTVEPLCFSAQGARAPASACCGPSSRRHPAIRKPSSAWRVCRSAGN